MSSNSKRRIETDVMKLLMGDHDVSLVNDKLQEFRVKFKGPKDTPFEGGTWKIHVELPDQYPYKSPSIGFENKIYHPNIDETSGSVCLDVINQTWSPMFDISNIFDTFLPQLLTYPNPSDPLNGDAASLMNLDKTAYENKIREYVKKYANDPNVKISDEDDADEDADDDEDEELSDVSSMDEDDDEDEDAMEDD